MAETFRWNKYPPVCKIRTQWSHVLDLETFLYLMMGVFCPNQTREYLTILFISVASIFITTLIIIFISFIRKIFYVSKQKPPRMIILSAVLLYIAILVGMTMHTIFVSDLCITSNTNSVYNQLVNGSYTIQCLLILWLWFIRLYHAFKGTLFKLSKITIIGYVSIFSISFVFVILMIADICFDTKNMDRRLYLLILLLLIVWFVILVISLTSLFIRKLINVYRNLDSDQFFIDSITKITILNFTSLSITIIWAFSLMFYTHSIHTEFVHHFGMVFEYFSTFICAVLSFNCYEKYYTQKCGKFHNQCNVCWLYLVRVSNKGQIVPTHVVPIHVADKSRDQ